MKIIESEKKINKVNINEIEDEFSIKLPENIRNFYLKYNGGLEETGTKLIDQFYSIRYGQNTIESVRNLMQVIEENIPKKYFIFATTGTGNLITINIDNQDPDFEKIFLFRHDELEPVLLSNSFEELLGIESIDDLE